MDATEAKRLREPFPPEAIGKLPKKWTDKNTGEVHQMILDYVGHAATTDRLLQVDPNWTWEPYALDEHGLPALDKAGNLWIKLTVCGVTRPGVGDGKTAKELIGDAIRNAAMRFGVALDLWAKEDLHANGDQAVQSLMERQKQRIQPRQEVSTTQGSAVEPLASAAQRKKLDVLVGQLRSEHITTEQLWAAVAKMRGINNIDALLDELRGKDMEGVPHWAPLRDSLTRSEASDLIDRLERLNSNVKAQQT